MLFSRRRLLLSAPAIVVAVLAAWLAWRVRAPVTPNRPAYGRRAEVTAYAVNVPKSEHLPADLGTRMIKNDFDWAAKNQARVIAEWRKRYDAKTEAKK